MPTIARPLVLADFAAGIFVNWGQWDFPIQIVDSDLPFFAGDGLGLRRVTVCDVQLFNHDTFVDGGAGMRRGFAQADRLLIAKYQNHASTLHLHFDPPVQAIGTCLSADGALGKTFFAQIELENPLTGARFSQSIPDTFADVLGGAPFVGVQGAVGELIQDAWFDVKSDEVISIDWIAMNQLLILP
jgi:hypothetical protein